MVKKVIAPLLKEDGFELKTKLFNDYVQPNKALCIWFHSGESFPAWQLSEEVHRR